MDRETSTQKIVEQINKFKSISFVPKGNSMYPMLKNKSQSVIVSEKTQRLEVMDVALFVRKDGSCILHRVLEVLEDGYVMCGDSQFNCERVLESQVFGVMTHFYKGKKLIEVDDKYRKKVKNFYRRKKLRKIRVKTFLFFERIKNKLRNKK